MTTSTLSKFKFYLQIDKEKQRIIRGKIKQFWDKRSKNLKKMSYLRYTVVKQPQFGNIQRLRVVDSSWVNVDSFTSSQIALGQVRYIHNNDLPVHDDFKVTRSLFYLH